VGYAHGPWRITLTLQHALAGTRHIHNGQSPSLLPYSVDGAYKTSIDAMALAVDCHF
jgi:hypothetical protein